MHPNACLILYEVPIYLSYLVKIKQEHKTNQAQVSLVSEFYIILIPTLLIYLFNNIFQSCIGLNIFIQK